jgi:hypothetical protein
MPVFHFRIFSRASHFSFVFVSQIWSPETNIIYHYLLEGDGRRPRVWGHTPPEKFWNLKPGNAISCILSIQICSIIYAKYTCIWNKRRKKRTKNKKYFKTITYHYLVVEKRNNLNRFCFKQGQRIKPKTYFPFIYLLFFAALFA